MNKAVDLSPMSIAIKRFICTIQIRRCPRGQVLVNSPSIVNPNALDSALTGGQPHRQLMLWQRVTLREGEKGLLVAD